MKNYLFRGIVVLFCAALVIGCATKLPPSKWRYSITMDRSVMSNPYGQGVWLSYIAQIRADMDNFYDDNPEGEYIIPFNVELNARESMIDSYLRAQRELAVNDSYVEDLIKIRTANLLAEYVFFSFNPGSWVNENNFQEQRVKEWLNNNMPEHKPLTLAKIERIN